MARWIYNRPPERCNEVEFEVSKKLNRLSDDWIIRWGFYYPDSQGVPREGDFLILGPTGGVLALAVKSAVRHFAPSGNWEGTDECDNPLVDLDAQREDVVRQLRSRAGSKTIPFVARALGVPHEIIPPKSTEHRGIAREFLVGFDDFENFAARWPIFFKSCVAVEPAHRVLFLDAYGEGIQPQRIHHFVTETDQILLRHTQQEYSVLDLLEENHQLLVRGGAGSGKTWMALEHARRLAEGGRSVLFLCYNLALARLLKEMTGRRKLSRGRITVMAWEELGHWILKQSHLRREMTSPPADPALRDRYYGDELPRLMCQAAMDDAFHRETDALVVDEGQDHDTVFTDGSDMALPGGWWNIYWALLKEYKKAPMGIYYDPAQRPVFRSGRFDIGVIASQIERPTFVRLGHSLRYTRPVFQYLLSLKTDATATLVEGLKQRCPLPEGPEVEFSMATREQTGQAVETIVRRWVAGGYCRPEQILILSRHSEPLKEGCFPDHCVGSWPLAIAGKQTQGQIGITSFHRAKGLDALAVLLIDTAPFEMLALDQQFGYWMAASRARQLLAVIASAPR